MCRRAKPGRAPAASTRTQSTLDSWYNVLVRRRRNLRRGRHQVSYNNHNTTQNSIKTPRCRTQLRLDDYIGYNESAQSWINAPVPINEDETFRLVGGNANGIKPYGYLAKFIPIVERLKSLQAGSVLLNETKVEWHRWEHCETAKKLLRNTFVGARVEFSTSKSKFESSLSAAVGPWANRDVKSGQDGTGCGRWTHLTYALKEDSYMTVMTAYRGCKQHEPGPKTAYMQEHTIQYADEELRPFIIDPHMQTIIDLEHFVQELKDKGHHVLIFIDANKDEQHQFQEQGHTVQLVTNHGFHVDG
jgi:hypothetical protein